MAKRNEDWGVDDRGEVMVHERRLLEQVQGRIERYYECLGRDLEFDVEVAQKAEQSAISKMAELNEGNLRARELRQNMLAISKFRQRTHESLVRVAEVLRAKEQTNIQVNFAEKGVEEEELFEALGVLQEAGVIDAEVASSAEVMVKEDLKSLKEDVGTPHEDPPPGGTSPGGHPEINLPFSGPTGPVGDTGPSVGQPEVNDDG